MRLCPSSRQSSFLTFVFVFVVVTKFLLFVFVFVVVTKFLLFVFVFVVVTKSAEMIRNDKNLYH